MLYSRDAKANIIGADQAMLEQSRIEERHT